MKWRILVIVALVLVASFAATPAFAEDPTDAQLYCAAATDQGLPNGLLLLQDFTSKQGYARQLTTPAAWTLAYPFITNEFCSTWGVQAPIQNPGEKYETVAPVVRWYAPYLRWLYVNLVANGLIKK